MTHVVVVLCTCPDSVTAQALATGLVGKGFAACVNILPEIRSIYRWENEIQQDSETLMVIKTSQESYRQLESWLIDNHPYDVPEVLALPIDRGSKNYLDWVIQATAANRG
jgi:periplasmic divalent cation tolerance protein